LNKAPARGRNPRSIPRVPSVSQGKPRQPTGNQHDKSTKVNQGIQDEWVEKKLGELFQMFQRPSSFVERVPARKPSIDSFPGAANGFPLFSASFTPKYSNEDNRNNRRSLWVCANNSGLVFRFAEITEVRG
jgi:hypothetical protein